MLDDGIREWIGDIQNLGVIDENRKILFQENVKTIAFRFYQT